MESSCIASWRWEGRRQAPACSSWTRAIRSASGSTATWIHCSSRESGAGAEIEQLERPLRHLEDDFPAISFRVAADLERHLPIESDQHLVAVEVEDAGGRRSAAPERAQVSEHPRHSDGGEPQLEAAGSAQRMREHLEPESVVRHRARRGDL